LLAYLKFHWFELTILAIIITVFSLLPNYLDPAPTSAAFQDIFFSICCLFPGKQWLPIDYCCIEKRVHTIILSETLLPFCHGASSFPLISLTLSLFLF